MATSVQPLVSLGFTALEAEVYEFLLQESPVTGYRVGQALNKPAPNIYKAIQSLEAKGAVMVDEAESRLCRAVPPEELLAQLERRFQARRADAARSLAEIAAPPTDDRVYQLRSADQVLERCRTMLRRCDGIALVDGFPRLIDELRPDLERAAARVRVAVKAYQPTKIPGVWVVEGVRSEATRKRWPGEWINVIIDGREHLVAFLTADGGLVHQAIWSGSTYLSWVYHSALASEIILDALERRIAEDGTIEELRQIIHTLSPIRALEAPGYQKLVRELGGDASGGAEGKAAD